MELEDIFKIIILFLSIQLRKENVWGNEKLLGKKSML